MTSTPKEIRSCLEQREINLDPGNQDHVQLFDDLNDIGILKISELGAEFIHATFQEYFAALYLIKSLKKSKKSSAHINAKEFIEQHKFDSNYRNVFSLIVHKLIDDATKTKNLEKKENTIKFLERYLSHFTTIKVEEPSPTPPQISYRFINENDIYQQTIHLLEIYSRGGLLSEETFIDQYGPFIELTFQKLLSTFLHMYEPKIYNEDSFIPSPNASSWILDTFAKIFVVLPPLRESLKSTNRLLENINEILGKSTPFSSSSSSSEVSQLQKVGVLFEYKSKPTKIFWNTFFFLQLSGGVSVAILCRLSQIVESMRIDPAEKVNCAKGMLELSMNYVESILKKESISDEENSAIQSLIAPIRNQLVFLHQTNRDVCDIRVVEKLINFCSLLSSHQNRSQTIMDAYQQTLIQLRQFAQIMFSSGNYRRIAACWKKLLSMQQEINLIAIFNHRSPLLIQSIEKLKKQILDDFENAKNNSDGRTIPSRAAYYRDIGFALGKLLQPIDWIDPSFGTKLINDLKEIVLTGGRFTNSYTVKDCKSEAWHALIQYKPYCTLNHLLSFERFEVIESLYENNWRWQDLSKQGDEINKRYLKKNQKTLNWLKSLKEIPGFYQGDRQWKIDSLIRDVEKYLRFFIDSRTSPI